MIRSTLSPIALSALCAALACSKSADSQPAGASATPAAGQASFVSMGAGACAKYLTPDVVAKILGGTAGPPKVLSAQSCSVTRTDDAGSITITLDNATAESFKAYQKYLSDPQPLAGVGDQAVSSMIGITSTKAPAMGCDIDAGGAPGSTKGSREERAKLLGDICNRIYADAK